MIDKRKALKESAAENQKLVDRAAILSQKAADAAQAFKDYAEGAYRVAQLSGQITEEDEKQHVQLKANAEEASRQSSESQGVAKQAADNLEQQKGKLIEQTGITDERRRYEEHVNQLLKERVPLIQDESLGARDRRETQQFGAPLTDYGRLQQQIKRLSDLGDRRDLTPAEESAARDAYVNSVKELRDRQIQAEKDARDAGAEAIRKRYEGPPPPQPGQSQLDRNQQVIDSIQASRSDTGGQVATVTAINQMKTDVLTELRFLRLQWS